MQYQVPQFIETEDKIVGPFSLKQFLYIAAGSGLSFMLFFALQSKILWFFFSAIVIGAALAFAFIKINGQPFNRIVASAFFYYWNPQKYTWQSKDATIKKEEVLKSAEGDNLMARIISGMVLKNTWRALQTGTKETPVESHKTGRERYQVLQRLSGERKIARRVDYR